jgi:hypothetical protein
MTRPIRWKGKYTKAVKKIDEHNKALVNDINQLVNDFNRTEHCQEVDDLLSDFIEKTEAMLSSSEEPSLAVDKHRHKLKESLTTNFPLSSRNGSACRQCGMCDQLEEQMTTYVDNTRLN